MTVTLEDSTIYAAHNYAANNWRVIPITPGRKFPPLKAWQDKATTDHAQIDDWWTGEFEGYGVGIATGKGFIVLDVDVSDGKYGDESLVDIEERYGKLPATLTVLTPTGGYHYYFRLPEGVEVRNDAGHKLGPGLDIRGDGGQVLAPPTHHPAGGQYQWELDGPDEMAWAPDFLVELLQFKSDDANFNSGLANSSPLDNNGAPGDDFNHRHTCHEILRQADWKAGRPDSNGNVPYTRPGKDTRAGHSATVWANNGKVSVWSTTPGIPVSDNLSPFALYAWLHHQGNYAAAASALRKLDYGKPRGPDDDTALFAAFAGNDDVDPDEVVECGWTRVPLKDINADTYPKPDLLEIEE